MKAEEDHFQKRCISKETEPKGSICWDRGTKTKPGCTESSVSEDEAKAQWELPAGGE